MWIHMITLVLERHKRTILQCHWLMSYCMNCCFKIIIIKLVSTSKYFDVVYTIIYGTMTRSDMPGIGSYPNLNETVWTVTFTWIDSVRLQSVATIIASLLSCLWMDVTKYNATTVCWLIKIRKQYTCARKHAYTPTEMSMNLGQSPLSIVNVVKYSTHWHSVNHFLRKVVLQYILATITPIVSAIRR